MNRWIDIAYLQETRWQSKGCRFFDGKGKRYKLLWMGSKEKIGGVDIFVAEKWMDSVLSVEGRSKQVMIVKLVLSERLINVFYVYAPHSGEPYEEKKSF